MSPLQNVTNIDFSIHTEELSVTYDGGVKNLNTNNGGLTFRAEKIGTEWLLHYTENNVVGGDFTEIKTRKTGSRLGFYRFNSPMNEPFMEFIGIQDIRDGAYAPWELAFGKSELSIQISGNALILRKKHY